MDIKKDIKELKDKYVEKYDPREYYFKVGDTAWTLYGYRPVKVEIVGVEDFKEHTGSPDAYVFYWIHMTNISKSKLRWENFKFKFWWYFLQYLNINQPKIAPELGPGHAVLPGDEIFKTAEEAIVDGYLQNLIFELDDLEFEKQLEN